MTWVIFGFFWEWRTVKDPLQSFYDAFCGKHLKTCDHFIPSPWFVSLGLDKLLNPTKTTYRLCDDTKDSDHLVESKVTNVNKNKPTCTSQNQQLASLKNDRRNSQVRLNRFISKNSKGRSNSNHFPIFRWVNQPFVFLGGTGALSFEKPGAFGHLKKLSQSLITIYWFLE